jgi:hypothetical protein
LGNLSVFTHSINGVRRARFPMIKDLLKGFGIIHGVLLLFAALGFIKFWTRTRFWLPKYVHFLAAVGLAVMIWCLSKAPADAPINRQGPIAKILVVLALPAGIYFFFIFYGGQRAAFESRFKTARSCPYCHQAVALSSDRDDVAFENASYSGKQCPRCGQNFS